MSDMTAVIAPKSDQINADDLIAGDLTITITGVKISPGQEQPVSIQFKGSDKVFRPCKSMSRVMVAAWGPDAKTYEGRSMTLYRDPTVKWGGLAVGGIRIRAMSHIDRDMTMMLSESKANRKPFKVAVLRAVDPQPQTPPDQPTISPADAVSMAERAADQGTEHFRAWFNSDEGKTCRATGGLVPDVLARLKERCIAADEPIDADPFGLPPLPTDPTPEALEKAEAEALAAIRAQDGEAA
jgi:hypothetical protein